MKTMKFLALFLFAISCTMVQAQGVRGRFDGRQLILSYNGLPLHIGGGTYLILSRTGLDDPATNYSSSIGNGGYMYNSLGQRGPAYLFSHSWANSTTLNFNYRIGPCPWDRIAICSVANDFSKAAIQTWQFGGGNRYQWQHTSYGSGTWFSGNSNTYDSIPPAQTSWGWVGLAVPEGKPSFIQANGTVADVRINIGTTTNFLRSSLTHHIGTNNAGFDSKFLTIGQIFAINGTIQIIPKSNPSLLYQCEDNENRFSGYIQHTLGRKDGDGWSINVNDAPGNFMCFGPYVSGFSGRRTASFRMLIDNNTSTNGKLLTVDVYDARSNRVLASRPISRHDFKASNKYQDFKLEFNASEDQVLEFRTYYNQRGAYIKQDRVVVQ